MFFVPKPNIRAARPFCRLKTTICRCVAAGFGAASSAPYAGGSKSYVGFPMYYVRISIYYIGNAVCYVGISMYCAENAACRSGFRIAVVPPFSPVVRRGMSLSAPPQWLFAAKNLQFVANLFGRYGK